MLGSVEGGSAASGALWRALALLSRNGARARAILDSKVGLEVLMPPRPPPLVLSGHAASLTPY